MLKSKVDATGWGPGDSEPGQLLLSGALFCCGTPPRLKVPPTASHDVWERGSTLSPGSEASRKRKSERDWEEQEAK